MRTAALRRRWQQRTVRPRATGAKQRGTRQPAGQAARAALETGARSNNAGRAGAWRYHSVVRTPWATRAKKTWGGAAGGAARRCPRRIKSMVCEFGTRCGQLWKPQVRRNRAGRIFARHQTGARCTRNPMWQGARRDQHVVSNNAPRGRGRRARRRRGAARTASQRGVAGEKSGERLAKSAHGAGSFGSAAQQRGPHPYAAHDGSETHEQRYVARHTARSQRRPEQHAARPRAADAKKTWGRVAGRAARRCQRRIGRTVSEFGTRRGQLWKPRRGATARAASCTAQEQSEQHEPREVARRTATSQRRAQESAARRRARDAQKTWGRAAGRAARRCRRRSGERFANMARAGAALGAAARQERATRATRCGKGAWRDRSVVRSGAP